MLDLVFVQVETPAADFGILADGGRPIAQQGAVWVIHPKRRPDLKDTDVMAAAQAAGLVDNKVTRISDAYSGLRFVIPKASRRPAATAHR